MTEPTPPPDRLDDRLAAAFDELGARESAAAEAPTDLADRVLTARRPRRLGSFLRSGPFLVGVAVVAGGLVGLALGRVTEDDHADSVATPVVAAGPVDAVRGYDCPYGLATTSFRRGDRVLSVGRSEDGAWLQLRDPQDLGRRVWVAADVVEPDGPTDDLPEVACGDDGPDTAGTELPTPTVSLPGPTLPTTTTSPGARPAPTTSSTPPSIDTPPTAPGAPPVSATPTPTLPAPPDDKTGPAITSASITPGQIWEDSFGLCIGKPKTATISVTADDPSGVTSVRASWTIGGSTHQVTLTGSGTYQGTFGPYPSLTVPSNAQETITVTVVARDVRGNTSTATTTVVVHSAGQCFS